MSSFWTRSYTHHLEAQVHAKADDIVALLHDPLRYLELTGNFVTDSLVEDKSQSGLYRGDEKLDLPFVKTTPLTIQHTALPDGARWIAQASLGVTVAADITVVSLGNEQRNDTQTAAPPLTRSRITETVTITAPLPSFLVSKPMMVQRHEMLFNDMDAFIRRAGIEAR